MSRKKLADMNLFAALRIAHDEGIDRLTAAIQASSEAATEISDRLQTLDGTLDEIEHEIDEVIGELDELDEMLKSQLISELTTKLKRLSGAAERNGKIGDLRDKIGELAAAIDT